MEILTRVKLLFRNFGRSTLCALSVTNDIMVNNKNVDLSFALPGNHQHLIISSNVIAKFASQSQTNAAAPEVGGQLFAEIAEDYVLIRVATGPYRQDQKTRFGFIPCRSRERQDIRAYFKQGLHYVGDWHTHPQPVPSPSRTDQANIQDCFRKSKHELQRFILIIVGTERPPAGLWVSLHDGQAMLRLQADIRSPDRY